MQLEREVGKRRKQMRQLGPLLKGTLKERKWTKDGGRSNPGKS